MNTSRLISLVSTMVVALFLGVPNLSWAEEGADLYKAKCAKCHGPEAEGKPAMKAPSLKDNPNLTAELLTTGDADKMSPHKKGITGVTEDQAKAIVEYVGSLK